MEEDILDRRVACENYSHYLYTDLRANAEARGIFDGNPDSESFLLKITVQYYRIRFYLGDTLVFLDEIRNYLNVCGTLKSLFRMVDFDVMTSGFFLGLQLRTRHRFPSALRRT